MEEQTQSTKLNILKPADPRSAFHTFSASQILRRFGPPRTLLSSSTKSRKCETVGVLARVMYLTPGVLCTHARPGCRRACLGHSSGKMQMPTHSICRDRRTALYLQQTQRFLDHLRIELHQLEHEAKTLRLNPAARLNGSSDIPWESRHPEIFEEFSRIEFFDYTKNPLRMKASLAGSGSSWPKNYHLTFSAAPGNHCICQEILEQRGNVAMVFCPHCPRSWRGYRVIDGDKHDARFLDKRGIVVGLRAKSRLAEDERDLLLRL